ncbi:site-specific integrase [Listeria monocytogenes]|uniref:site-specific integrase n=1 Tax=Listeria monocytogenes TaxID=1639 RepID=UPI000994A70F|nr:site-specific integrase [Listeria monocytogenes]EAC4638162.1 site-specific integrase [Listeria monocytogenes]EAC9089477.1 site-specific integrase [Listeria monocytogenes]EAD2878098.1 site-specific integrase [Listeria monocytogenes]EAD7781924.1 site-specific integrase [Listeria monocytogenes]EAD8106917.1 site-specific integrase [Listeria monocytogenes]
MAKKKEILFCDYFENWIETYKVGAIADVTLQKYYMVARHLRNICPKLFMSDFDRVEYQKIINEFAKTHEKQTTTDFHHQVKGCIMDAFHDGLLERDPTYRAVMKGKEPREKRKKFLQKDELTKLLHSLDLTQGINRDWFILLLAKTGMRFAEGIAITPADFDWATNQLTINKTWDYKTNKGFKKTKTESSVRKIVLDWQIIGLFKPLIENLDPNEPIFVEKFPNGTYKAQFNSTYNIYLVSKCKALGIPEISLHALRHTHASVLLAEGVSIHTISARLGHANVGVTQETYAHVLDDLKKKDDQMMMSTLMSIA